MSHSFSTAVTESFTFFYHESEKAYMQMNENKIFREYAGPFLSKAGTFASVDCRSGKFLTLEKKRNQFGFIGKAGK